MHLRKIGGFVLTFGGLLVWVGVFGNFPFCFGSTVGATLITPSFCAGVTINLNGYIGVFLAAIGLIILTWTFAKERKLIG